MALFGNRANVGWWALGLLLAGIVAYVVTSFIGTFALGVFLYYATRPIHRRISRRISQPSVAAAVSLFALALPALALVGYALLVAVREAFRLSQSTTVDPAALLGIQSDLLAKVVDPAALVAIDWEQYVTVDRIGSLFRSLASAADTLSQIGIGGVHLFVMIALAFYLLRDDQRIARWVHSQFDDQAGVLRAYTAAVDRDLNSIFFGNILNAVLTGTIGVIAFSVLNVWAPPGSKIPAAALVGLLAGVASLIPVVGMKLVYVPVAAYMFARAVVANDAGALWFVGTFVVVSFLIVDSIPDFVLRPYVSGRNLHVGSIMIAYVLGPLLFGWYGLFLLPLVLVLTVHFARITLPELIGTTTIRPFSVDPTHLTEESFEWYGEESD
ncbi:MAG: AI-2E family transporter [Haloferacaceae archaeon]